MPLCTLSIYYLDPYDLFELAKLAVHRHIVTARDVGRSVAMYCKPESLEIFSCLCQKHGGLVIDLKPYEIEVMLCINSGFQSLFKHIILGRKFRQMITLKRLKNLRNAYSMEMLENMEELENLYEHDERMMKKDVDEQALKTVPYLNTSIT